MAEDTTITVGADVHKERITICALRGDGQLEEVQEFVNDPAVIRKVFRRLAKQGSLRVCYEAGPCGYTFRRELEALKVSCEVIAPSLIPKRSGDKVKTDRRDACKLARLYRAGELTTIRIPTEKEEIARDLLRCREDLGEDINRQRHRLLKFLLRHGRVWRGSKNWTQAHWAWLHSQTIEDTLMTRTFQEYLMQLENSLERQKMLDREIEIVASQSPWKEQVDRLKSLRGIGTLTAMILLTEICDFRRFSSPRELMNFIGVTPGIHASAGKGHMLPITKTGNAHVRRVLVEAAWNYTRKPQWPSLLSKRCAGQPSRVLGVVRTAQTRLNQRYRHLRSKGKTPNVAVVAVARELLGFIWDLMVNPDEPSRQGMAQA